MDKNFLDHYSFAKGYAQKLCGDTNLAADIVQQVYLKLSEKNINIPENNYRGYLTQCIKYAYINHYRRKKKYRFIDISEHSSFLICQENDSTFSEPVKNALEGIDNRFKMPLLLMFLYGYNLEEISSICSIPVGTVKNRIFNAKKQLKEQLL